MFTFSHVIKKLLNLLQPFLILLKDEHCNKHIRNNNQLNHSSNKNEF